MDNVFLNKLTQADNLPSMPTVALEVLRLTRCSEVSTEEVAAAVQQDPALTVKILKVVNSSLFGFSREIMSLKHAMVILGMRTVKVIVLSFSLVDSLSKDSDSEFDYNAFWRRSLTSAVAARLLARSVSPNISEEAFIGGLLSDLGMLVAVRCGGDEYQQVLSRWAESGESLVQIEQDMLGLTHADISRELINHWGLPESLGTAIGMHHSSLDDVPEQERAGLVGIVRASAAIASAFCQDNDDGSLDDIKAKCLSCTGINDASLEQVMEEIDGKVRETANLLSLSIGETMDYAQIRSDATLQLAQLSMQAELDLQASTRQTAEAQLEAQRLQDEKQRILEVASTDNLTQISNRACFDKRLLDELQRAKARHESIALFLLDVDHFKKFNDTYGHQAGDEVLRCMGRCLKETVIPAGFPARYGGEEFAAILTNINRDEVLRLAESLRKCIEACECEHDSKVLKVTASVGVAIVAAGNTYPTPEQFIKVADVCLYRAKDEGRNRVKASQIGSSKPEPATETIGA